MPTVPATRIVGGRRVLVICGILVVVLAGVAGRWMVTERPRPGAYLDALALDGDFVVALREERTSGRAFVELYGEGEGMRWQALVPRYAAPDGAVGVAASERAVTVRFPRDGRTQVFGFSAVAARKLGTVILGKDLPAEPDGHMAAGVATIGAGALTYELLEPDGGPTRVYAVSLTQGAIAWERALPRGGVVATWATAGHLVVAQPGAVSVLAREDGAIATTAADEACVAPGPDGDVLVVTRDGAVEASAVGGAPLARGALPGGGRFTGLCGVRGGTLHALAATASGELVLVSAPLTGGTAPAPRALGAGVPGEATARARVAAAARLPFAGRLRRIVPVRVVRAGEVRLVGIDVERGAIAWERRAPADLGELVDAGTAALARAGDVLVSIDPATGEARAVRAPDTRPLRAHHVAGGTVWLIGGRGLLALDAATLAPRGRFRAAPAVEPAAAPLVDPGS